ncbi:MAG TPA: WD40 repeat domain-containing protein [Gemmataceae bacterium]|nr:WD40 repeat domain-containing protein [Gemmataceae bacterium]
MPSLRILTSGSGPGGHDGEVFCCAFTHDNQYVLSGGWDGHLRLSESNSGTPAAAFRASHKPIAACVCSPDGKHLVSGCLEGFLSFWDSGSHRPASKVLAHARPISAIAYAPDGKLLATASWDRSLALWDPNGDRDRQSLNGHSDIVAGCRFTPDGHSLLSWSHDGTVGLWQVAPVQRLAWFRGHSDRVNAVAISPDGARMASASRDQSLKLWDLQTHQELASYSLTAEAKGCCFLLDGESLVAIDARGRVTLHSLPELELQSDLATRLPVQCAELSSSGNRIAVGCGNGQVHLIAIDGFDSAPLLVSATQTSKRTATRLQRFFGRDRLTHAYHCTCPVCRQAIELSDNHIERPLPCPGCQRQLRVAK